ncbi:hypothetical protein QUF80_03155 [Desulfococcaceae bacterium HSG8]|nr:hypothetical protein [Desulfococcaceae bacterium HSG8]
MNENLPERFKLKAVVKGICAFVIFELILAVTVVIYYLPREIDNMKKVYEGSAAILIISAILIILIWIVLYGSSTVTFYEDHLKAESLLGRPIRIDYTDIVAIDRGGGYKLRSAKKNLELSSFFKNSDKMRAIADNRIRQFFEKNCMEKFGKNQTFICRAPALIRTTPIAVILISILSILCYIYMFQWRYLFPMIVFFGGFWLLLAVSTRGINTQYLVNSEGIEVKNRFSSKQYQWEDFIGIEHLFMGHGRGNIVSIILQTRDKKKIAIRAILDNFEALRLIAETKIPHDKKKM